MVKIVKKDPLKITVTQNDTPKILFLFYKIKYNRPEKKSEIQYQKKIIANGKFKSDGLEQPFERNFIAIKILYDNGEEKTKKLVHPLRIYSETIEEGKLHNHLILLDSADLVFRVNCEKSIKKIEISENLNDHNNYLGSILYETN